MYTMPSRKRGFGDTASVQCGPDEEYDLAAMACVKKGTALLPAPSVNIPQIPTLPQFGPPSSPEQPPMKPMPTPAQVLPQQQAPAPAPAPAPASKSVWPWVVGGLAVVGVVALVRSV